MLHAACSRLHTTQAAVAGLRRRSRRTQYAWQASSIQHWHRWSAPQSSSPAAPPPRPRSDPVPPRHRNISDNRVCPLAATQRRLPVRLCSQLSGLAECNGQCSVRSLGPSSSRNREGEKRGRTWDAGGLPIDAGQPRHTNTVTGDYSSDYSTSRDMVARDKLGPSWHLALSALPSLARSLLVPASMHACTALPPSGLRPPVSCGLLPGPEARRVPRRQTVPGVPGLVRTAKRPGKRPGTGPGKVVPLPAALHICLLCPSASGLTAAQRAQTDEQTNR